MGSEQIDKYYDPACYEAGCGPVSLDVITPDGDHRAISGLFHVFGGKSLIISTTERIPPSTPIATQYDDILFVGEVLACNKESDVFWTVRIKVKHTLNTLQSLMLLHDALLGALDTELDVEGAHVLRREPSRYPAA